MRCLHPGVAHAVLNVPIPSRLSLRGANQPLPGPGAPLAATVAPRHHHRVARFPQARRPRRSRRGCWRSAAGATSPPAPLWPPGCRRAGRGLASSRCRVLANGPKRPGRLGAVDHVSGLGRPSHGYLDTLHLGRSFCRAGWCVSALQGPSAYVLLFRRGQRHACRTLAQRHPGARGIGRYRK
jgi:hypothetical protein